MCVLLYVTQEITEKPCFTKYNLLGSVLCLSLGSFTLLLEKVCTHEDWLLHFQIKAYHAIFYGILNYF
jgi:hypothetical protein